MMIVIVMTMIILIIFFKFVMMMIIRFSQINFHLNCIYGDIVIVVAVHGLNGINLFGRDGVVLWRLHLVETTSLTHTTTLIYLHLPMHTFIYLMHIQILRHI